MNTCPPESQWEELAADRVSPCDSADLWSHLDRCAPCRRRYEQACHRDSLLEPLRAALAEVRGTMRSTPQSAAGDGPRAASGDDADPMAALPSFPGYRVSRQVARTHLSVVYDAIQEATGQRVAIKVMALPGTYDPRVRSRFEREIELLVALRHPRIVPIYDSGMATGLSYFIMPFIDGRPPDAYVEDRHVPFADRVRMLVDICHTVHFAHMRGVIHRDLKPSNILVDEEGRPHVLDFGLGKLLGEHDDSGQLTLTADSGHILGTPSFMSPEQAAGRKDEVDIRSDVYALGVLMYRVLTGAMPYPTDGVVAQTLAHIRQTDPTPPHVLNPRFDREVETILLKALAKEKERRYQSAAELAGDLNRYLLGEPIEARRDSYGYRVRKTLRRHRVAAGVTAGYALIVTTALVISLALWRQAEDRRLGALTAERASRERFAQVRHLANTFLFDVYDQIRDLPGGTRARALLVSTAQQYLDSLYQQVGDDRDLALELAEACNRLGNVLGNPNYANQGDFDAALEVYRKGLRLLEPLRQADPEDTDVLSAFQLAHTKIGDVLIIQSRLDEALEHYRTAQRLIEGVLAQQADLPGPRRSLASCQKRISMILRQQGRTAEAFEAQDKALELRQALAQGEAPEAQDLAALANALGDTADLHVLLGRLEEALRSAESSLQISQRAAAAEVEHVERQRDLAVAHNRLGGLHERMGRPELAVSSRRAALDLHRALAAADPDDVRARRDVSIALAYIGDALMALHHPEEALGSYQESFDVVRTLAPPDTPSPLYQRDYCLSHFKIGEALQKCERIAEAHEHYMESLRYNLMVAQADPSNRAALRDVSASYDVIGETQMLLGRHAEAMETFQISLDISLELLAEDPTNARLQRDLVLSYSKMGSIHETCAKQADLEPQVRGLHWSHAARWFQQALDLTREMKQHGRLAPADEYFLAELDGEIRKCQRERDALAGTQAARADAG